MPNKEPEIDNIEVPEFMVKAAVAATGDGVAWERAMRKGVSAALLALVKETPQFSDEAIEEMYHEAPDGPQRKRHFINIAVKRMFLKKSPAIPEELAQFLESEKKTAYDSDGALSLTGEFALKVYNFTKGLSGRER